jgi:hypothetical protein
VQSLRLMPPDGLDLKEVDRVNEKLMHGNYLLWTKERGETAFKSFWLKGTRLVQASAVCHSDVRMISYKLHPLIFPLDMKVMLVICFQTYGKVFGTRRSWKPNWRSNS